MSVFREVTVEFRGAEYRFVPSNKLLRRIDADLAPQTLFGVIGQMDGKQAPLPAIACIISHLLNAGGGKFTEDDVLVELYDDVRSNGGQGIAQMMQAIAECITLPGAEVHMGNPEARGEPGKPEGKKAKALKGR